MFRDILLISFTMLSLDSIYLYSWRHFFEKQIADVQKSRFKMNIQGLVPCYIALVLGLYYFIVREKKPVWDAFLLGIFVYLVFESTNLAIFSTWRPITVLVDTAWGGILFALTTWIVYRIKKTVL